MSKITEMLKRLCIRPNLRGYEYIQTAVKLVLEDREKIHRLTKVLYPEIGDCFDVTPESVERAMRNAIYSGRYRAPEEYKEVFGHHYKPTTGEFISTIVEQIREDQ